MTKEILEIWLKVCCIGCGLVVLGVTHQSIFISPKTSIKLTGASYAAISFTLFTLLIKNSNLLSIFLDSTHIKAHQHSNSGNGNLECVSKRIAGLATKIYLAVDAHGNPIPFVLSDTEFLSVYKGYDSDALQGHVEQVGKRYNFPQKQNTKFSKEHMSLNKVLYLVENTTAKLKTIQ